jgi:hypothetical protein
MGQPQNKASATTKTGQTPAWATPGTDAYKQQNSYLSSGPIAAVNQIIGSGGLTPQMRGVAEGPSTNAAMREALSGYRGQVNGTSPYLNDIISKGSQDVATQINNQFAAGGRYGSTANQKAVADAVSAQANQLRNQDYQSGLSGLASLGQQSFNNRISQAQVGQQGVGNVLSAIGSLPTVQNNKLFDANAQAQVGQQIDQRAQTQLNDKIKQLTGLDMQNWTALSGLLTGATQAAGNWGTQSGTTTSTQPFNVLGAIGTLGSLFFSDRRLKVGVRAVGTEHGLPISEFAYAWAPERRYRGVIAQDIADRRPDAIASINGVLFVDYARLGVELREV